MARREEWQQQVLLSTLLAKWLDNHCTFATAIDNVARDATSGAMRRSRGVQPGLPDILVWYRGKTIAIEMKSQNGRCTLSQRAVRERLQRAGLDAWWEVRSAYAAMWALRKSGVKFRTIVHEDGRIERWRQPKLAAWEVPRTDPSEPRPIAPEVKARRRAAQRRWREQQRRAREIPQPLGDQERMEAAH